MLYEAPETALIAAIEQGDLARVRKLIGSGICVNIILHSHVRRESATALGTACFEGQLEIIDFLIQKGSSVNFKDPYFGRNALQWACLGGHTPVVDLLLHHGAEVNCVDRDNVSPILRASMTGNADIVRLLLSAGANVHQVDRLRSSALHYATFHGKPQIIGELIRAGCLHNNPTIFGQGTPLANLVYHKDLEMIKSLLEAGYEPKNESWLSGWSTNGLDNKEDACVAFILQMRKNAYPLKSMCRTSIRNLLQGISIKENIMLLPLPPMLLRYLCLEV